MRRVLVIFAILGSFLTSASELRGQEAGAMEKYVSFINIILILAGCLVVLLSILFSRRLSGRIQKIELQKLGINLSVDAVTLFVIVGLSIALSGFYLHGQDVKHMSDQITEDSVEIERLQTQLAAAGTVLTCQFTLDVPNELLNDPSVQYYYFTKEKEGLNELKVRKEVKVVEGDAIPELLADVTLNANDFVTIRAQRGDKSWQSEPFQPTSGHRLKLVEITAAMAVTPAEEIPSHPPLQEQEK